MPEGPERARRYRHHAEKLRAMAKQWRDPETLQKVNDLARDYDRMAADLEHSAGGEKVGVASCEEVKAPPASPPVTSVGD